MFKYLGTGQLPEEIKAGNYDIYRRFGELSAYGMRFVVYADKIESMTADGEIVRDWSDVDTEMGLMQQHGLHVYVNVVGAPPHWCNGARTWMEGIGSSCIDWMAPGKSLATTYMTTKDGVFHPECDNPPAPDATMLADFTRELVKRYKDWKALDGTPLVFLIGIGNEFDDPNSPLGWLKSAKYGGDWKVPAQRSFAEWHAPFARAVKQVAAIPVAGPESATYGWVNTVLMCERGQRWEDWDPRISQSPPFYFDIISPHNYAESGTFPQAALDRLNVVPGNLLAYLAQDNVREGRLIGIGESGIEHGEDPSAIITYLEGLDQLDRVGTIAFEYVTMMIGDSLFKLRADGRIGTEPTEFYGVLQKWLSARYGKHRGVRS